MQEIEYRGRDGWPLFAEAVGHAGGHPPLVLMHGGGPDHRSLLPLAKLLAGGRQVVLPDVRGYGRSACPDPALHAWARYADDVAALLDHMHAEQAVAGGAGLGGTVALRFALAHPARTRALVLVSVEDIEDDEAKHAEVEFMDAFAARVRAEGIEAGWRPILPTLPPVIGSMVRDAILRTDPASAAAAAAIGRDRSFRSVRELAAVAAPALVIPGIDWRHPPALAEELARVLPNGRLARVAMSAEMRDAEDFAQALAPAILGFLAELEGA
jgi:pimeloyl-ACP methyl ester carboxylesterase